MSADRDMRSGARPRALVPYPSFLQADAIGRDGVGVNRAVGLGLAVNAATNRPSVLDLRAHLPTAPSASGHGVRNFDMWLTDGALDPRALPERPYLRHGPSDTTGVCLSGGGSRAAAAAVGFLRGLCEIDLLEQVDFITACSGGAYALVPFQYYCTGAKDDVELLGKSLPPEELTRAHLDEKPSASLVRCITKPILGPFASQLVTPQCVDGSAADEAWQYTLADIFLRPYGLEDPDALFAASEAHAQSIRERNPSLAQAQIHVRRPGRPFDIYTATFAPPCAPPPDTRAVIWRTNDFVPFDVTPLYCGSAVARDCDFETFRTIAAAKDESDVAEGEGAGERRTYRAGGFVETFAVGSTVAPTAGLAGARPRHDAPAPLHVTASALASGQLHAMSLPKALDATSNAYCGITNNTGAREALMGVAGMDLGNAYSRLMYWSPLALTDEGTDISGVQGGGDAGAGVPAVSGASHGQAEAVFVSDGGGHDLAGIMPMLTRSVRRIVCFLSFGYGVSTTFPLDGGPSGRQWKGSPEDLDGQLPAYFGVRASNCEHMMHSLDHVQVFEPADFWRLAKALRNKVQSGGYPVAVLDHKVRPNEFWGVKGGYTARVCWVVLERVPSWEARLPQDLRDQLARDCETKEGEFRHFPNYLVTGQNKSFTGLDMHLTAAQANLSGQLASSYVHDNEDVFRAMFSGSGPGAHGSLRCVW